LALARVNYSQLYHYYDDGRTYAKRDVLIPYQLITLAAHVRERGVDVRIFDGEVDLWSQEELAMAILEWQPHFVGLTSTTADICLALSVCERIKMADSAIVTILGGPHASAVPEDVARHAFVDYVVAGDGEYPLDIVINRESNGALSGLIAGQLSNDLFAEAETAHFPGKIIRGKLKSLLRQPMPAHDMLDYRKYHFTDPIRGRGPAASIMSSRGCPYDCTFCFHDRRWRTRTVEQFIEEIAYLAEHKGIKFFYVYDDTFTRNKKRALRILSAIGRLNAEDLHFQCLTRGDMIDEELVDAFANARFVRVSFGVESGSDRILRLAGKRIRKKDYRKSIRMLRQAGILTRASLILGHPFETEAEVQETIAFATELELIHANFNIMTPYPGTAVYEMAKRNQGISFAREQYAKDWTMYRRWGKALIRTEHLGAEDLEHYQKEAHETFYTQESVYRDHHQLFMKGNASKYFYRPLNDAWRKRYQKDIPFWDALEEDSIVDAPRT